MAIDQLLATLRVLYKNMRPAQCWQLQKLIYTHALHHTSFAQVMLWFRIQECSTLELLQPGQDGLSSYA